ncbi:hypothetical protein PENARI_c003G09603 [Penicillium arizonense]|uniref:Uncharacterized protein n=1 Tax=Penicillium arizonense TaxID=1835702 RepID=A0A1F5LU72_PENAI|nr:hypothetical protein PENARI_c003G09603 [Penicillium arizonense]OGE56620.1 hypothetical protein PENARI_c003G09603 [Penicillium arizonense]
MRTIYQSKFSLSNQPTNSTSTTITTTTTTLPKSRMKTNILILLATLTASVMATPTANAEASEIFERSGSCYHPSSCSRSWAGKCEDYCGSRGFSHMTGDGCGWLAKKCCCSKS